MNKHQTHQHAWAQRWMVLTMLFIFQCSLFISGAAAQQLRVEYFFDSDPGRGKATSMSVATDADGNFSFDAPTTGLTPGNHLLGVRAYVADDNDKPWHYGPTLTQQVYVPHDEAWINVSRVEYFWDEDPGHGNGTAIDITPGSTVDLDRIEISTAELTPGTHLLGIRAYGGWGWGPTITQEVYVPLATNTAGNITSVEYFWDSDPGFGLGTAIAITPGQEIDLDNVELSVDGLSVGEHHLFIRAYGYAGWTPTIESVVTVMPHEADIMVEEAEYFWDEDPGFGHGTPLTITPGQQVSTDGLGITVDGLSIGEHQLFVRYRGLLGWSPTVVADVVNISDADLRVSTAEYFWNDDPGFGHGTPIALTPGETVNIDDFQVPSASVHGDAVLFIRYRGPMGWSPTVAYPVMVDAEGNYTLNANAETSMEQRNYQSLTDALNDFTDRGIGNSITLTLSTTNTDYALDATSEQVLSQLAQAAENLDIISDLRTQKTIAFTATEGSGNTLSVTTTDEGLPTVVSFFAKTTLTNVALTINGTAYDFTSAVGRSEEVCAQSETTPVDLTAVSSAVTVTFTAQPHEGIVLSGFPAEATGTLPMMTISHSGTKLDSIAYAVTLATAGGQTLYEYTYYIYVHPRMADQTVNGQTPETDSSLDPGEVTLTWTEVDDAIGGYRLNISAEPMDANASALSGYPAEVSTPETAYTMTAVTGYTYTWTVTAIGYCDEKTSTAMTFSGRLLPDLVVSSITSPEAAKAGNTITVTATVSNQGAGATTEGSWTDRLYYTIDSNDFTQAVEAAEMLHEGNLAAAASYDVTFTMHVPAVDNGNMRFFVVTDAADHVMEGDNSNNRTQSATTATLSPFYMNTDDLAALRKLYTDFGGSEWNGTQWNTTSELIADGNWSGVSFDTDGRVTAINLQGRNLSGALNSTTAPALPRLTTLNMSRNALTGDPTAFIVGMPLLATLNLAYNQIDELSGALPLAMTVNLTYQHRRYGNDNVFPGINNVTAAALTIGGDATPELPTVLGYNHQSQTLTNHPTLEVRNHSTNVYYGTVSWDGSKGAYIFAGNGREINVPDECTLRLQANYTSATMNGSVYPATASVTLGDATIDGAVDVNDVQRTLLRIIDPNRSGIGTINLWAANTYDSGETDMVINIQDIVCTVNMVLDNQQSSSRALARQTASEATEDVANLFYSSGGYLCVNSRDEIAAFDMEVEGVEPSQVRLLLDENDWQMATRRTSTGTRLIVFSPNGATLPAGTTRLLQTADKAVPVSVQATSPLAIDIDAAVLATTPTGVSETTTPTLRVSSIAGGLLLTASTACGPLTISVYDTQGRLLTGKQIDSLPAGKTHLPMTAMPADGIVIVRISGKGLVTNNYKLQIAK